MRRAIKWINSRDFRNITYFKIYTTFQRPFFILFLSRARVSSNNAYATELIRLVCASVKAFQFKCLSIVSPRNLCASTLLSVNTLMHNVHKYLMSDYAEWSILLQFVT